MMYRLFTSQLPWLVAALVAGVAIGALSVLVQEYFAPLGVFPVLQGLLLGGLLVAALRACQMGKRWLALTGVVLATGSLFAALFVGSYWRFNRNFDQRVPSKAELLGLSELQKPASFGEYLARQAEQGRPLPGGIVAEGGWAWMTWVADWLIATLTAGGIVWLAFHRPYCHRCHQWFRPVGEGWLSATAARRACKIVQQEPPLKASAEYWLWSCPTAGHGSTLDLDYRRERKEPGKRRVQQRLAFDDDAAAQLQAVLRHDRKSDDFPAD